jgi:hypothetical protein
MPQTASFTVLLEDVALEGIDSRTPDRRLAGMTKPDEIELMT